MTFKKRLLRTFILGMVGLAIGGAIAYIQIKSENAVVLQNNDSAQVMEIKPLSGVNIGGAFELIDQNGVLVSEQDFNDKFKFIYFGFTYCPAICPTELQKMTTVLNMLDDEIAKNIQPIFITIDPERDTPEVMKQYITLFHDDFVGLSGSKEQIDTVKKVYKVFATRVEDDGMSDYTMDHSSFIYLMSKDNKALAVYRMRDEADYIAKDVSKIVALSD